MTQAMVLGVALVVSGLVIGYVGVVLMVTPTPVIYMAVPTSAPHGTIEAEPAEDAPVFHNPGKGA